MFDFISQEVLAYSLSALCFGIIFLVIYFAYETVQYNAREDATSQIDREEEMKGVSK